MKPAFDPAEFAMHRSGLSLTDAAWECDIDPANLSSSDIVAIRECFSSL